MIVVTDHAVERYIEHVENVTPDKARSLMLSNKAVQLAAKFGAPYIRLHSDTLDEKSRQVRIVERRGGLC